MTAQRQTACENGGQDPRALGSDQDTLRVMIVDDEKLIRSLIRMRVDWPSLGMEIVAEAASAGEALAMLDTVAPDIIFTDICMPSLDGIAFSRMVIERNPSIRIVIVTGHDEFEYAKSCIKIGVSDFLLKPLRAEELTRTAESLRNKIREERLQGSILLSLQQQQQQARPTIQESALGCLLSGCGDITDSLQKLREMNAFPDGATSGFQVAIISLKPTKPADDTEIAAQQLTAKAYGILQRLFQKITGVFVLRDGTHRMTVVSGNSDVDDETYGNVLLTQLLNGCHCHVGIGTGSRVAQPEDLSLSYQQASRALSFQIVLGNNRVIRHEDMARMPAEDSAAPADRMGQLSRYLRAGMTEKARDLMEEGFSSLMPDNSRCLAMLRREALDVVLACGQARREALEEPETQEDASSGIIEHALEIDNLPDMKRFLGQLIEQVALSAEQKPKSNAIQLVEKVLAYIHNNLADPALSLSGTASVFYVSPSHLSRLFRRETGRSFVEYVTKERMDQAFSYVTRSNMKSCEIGKRVGIDDPHYFSILFKKHAGMTVNECRKR